jgi:hypothetical protein
MLQSLGRSESRSLITRAGCVGTNLGLCRDRAAAAIKQCLQIVDLLVLMLYSCTPA